MIDTPMTEPELKSWVSSLGHSTAERMKAIEDLLKHANGDEMSTEDRTICRKTLDRLRNGDEIVPEVRVIQRPRIVNDDEEY